MGAKENAAAIWNIEDVNNPKKLCVLLHPGPVTAILFCPWSDSLLATGGGTLDRCIRFWHTPSATQLSKHNTKRRITSITWSSTRKELAVTFGFLSPEPPLLLAVYSYPDMAVVAVGSSPEPLQAFGATVSPTQDEIALATNDGNVMIYELWEPRMMAITGHGFGIFGSSLVANAEGADVQGGHIR